MAAIESIWFSFILLVMIWPKMIYPYWTRKITLPKKFTYNIEIQKWSNHGLQMTKLKIQVKFFQD